jgi:hypothetical protein
MKETVSEKYVFLQLNGMLSLGQIRGLLMSGVDRVRFETLVTEGFASDNALYFPTLETIYVGEGETRERIGDLLCIQIKNKTINPDVPQAIFLQNIRPDRRDTGMVNSLTIVQRDGTSISLSHGEHKQDDLHRLTIINQNLADLVVGANRFFGR